MSIALQDVMEGFVLQSNTPGGPDTYFLKLDRTAYVVQNFAYVTSTLIADSILVSMS